MKKIVKIMSLLLVVALLSFSAFACTKEPESVSVKYYASAADVLPLMKTGKAHVALLPEPAATKLESMTPDKTWYRLDLQQLYDAEEKSYPQAVLMVKTSVINEYADEISGISQKFSENVEWIKSNTTDAVNAVNAHLQEGVTPSLAANAINAKVVENCKIYYQSAADAKEQVKGYISDIIAVEQTSAKAVADDFFFAPVAAEKTDREGFTFVAPDGAPALAIAKFIADEYSFGIDKPFDYKIVASSNIGGVMQKGTADFVIMPINAASKLYKAHSADPYQMVAVVTHGNLYIMSDEEIEISDLKEKEVAVIGQGLVPDLTFKSVLSKNRMKAVAI